MKNLPALLFILAAWLCPQSSIADAHEGPYRIGVIIPLSGPVASLGNHVRKGIALAYDNLSEDSRRSIQLIYSDDRFDPKQTIIGYQQLSAQKPLDAVFVLGSPPANALAPITEKNKQVLVAIGASDPDIVKGRRYTFIHWVIPPMLGKRMSEELIRRDFKRIALVSAEASGALADKNSVVDALQSVNEGSRIIYDQSFQPSETDYRSAITSLKAKKVDAVILVLMPGALSSFTKQAQQLGLNAEIAGMETFEDEDEVKASQGTLLNKWYVNGADPTDEFVNLYKSKYGIAPGWAAGNAYDSLNLIALAISEDLQKTNDGVQNFLANVQDYRGAAGTYSSSSDNRYLLPAALKRITQLGFVSIVNSEDHGPKMK
ncbi:MAG: ABC transporter substrate-binding protein [Deltaproteobacteria bacterium]|nr:ABC transporter substrate-binding protein [Deltaproteobacteria bacterium]